MRSGINAARQQVLGYGYTGHGTRVIAVASRIRMLTNSIGRSTWEKSPASELSVSLTTQNSFVCHVCHKYSGIPEGFLFESQFAHAKANSQELEPPPIFVLRLMMLSTSSTIRHL
eukprot:2508532-Rhodomonas_salina.1